MAKKNSKTARREETIDDEDLNAKFVYHSPDELRAMTLEEIKALYDQIPTERQQALREVYDVQLLNAGAKGEDAHEYQVAVGLLRYFEVDHVVPSGKKWSVPSAAVFDGAVNNAGLVDNEVLDRKKKAADAKPNLLPVIIGFVVVLGYLVLRARGSGPAPTSSAVGTPLAMATAVVDVTPTPVALENIDAVAGKSEGGGVQFPIKLLVQNGDKTQPRVFVVQRRAIKVADWLYTDDPETATFISGLTVRPIIGIPYSAENAALFDSMTDGTTFSTQTSTGSLLRYNFVSKLPKVVRYDTNVFSQDGPGIVLILIGQRDEASQSPTEYRTVVTASYDPAQELVSGGLISNVALQPAPPPILPTPTLTPTPVRKTTLEFVRAGYGPDYLLVQVHILNVRDTPVTFRADDIWVAYGYAPRPDQPRTPSENMEPFTILPNQAADVTVYFRYDRQAPFASVGFGQGSEWELAFQIPVVSGP